jgi:DNA polymerase elongation subunit (family B)
VYRWLSDYDYSSYYPNCIRSLNLGIETLIGRIVIDDPTRNIWWGLIDLKNKDPELEVEFEILNKETYTFSRSKVTIGKLVQTIESKNWAISANGVCFDKSKISIAALVLADWFEMRKVYKHKMEDAYKSGDDVLGKLYDSQQHAFKIMLNSLYGAFAINSWRFSDGFKILSSAITCSCQRLLQETILHANKTIDEKYLNI